MGFVDSYKLDNGRTFTLTPIEDDGLYGCEITEIVEPADDDTVNMGTWHHARTSVPETYASIVLAVMAGLDKVDALYGGSERG